MEGERSVTAKKRNSNLELLRVLAILSVIALHAFRHAAQGRIFDANLSLNYILAIFTSCTGTTYLRNAG